MWDLIGHNEGGCTCSSLSMDSGIFQCFNPRSYGSKSGLSTLVSISDLTHVHFIYYGLKVILLASCLHRLVFVSTGAVCFCS